MGTTKFVTVKAKNKPGQLGKVARALANDVINIDQISSHPDGFLLRTNDPARTVASLKRAGYKAESVEVFEVDLPNKPGQLAALGEALGAADINIEGLFATATGATGKAFVWVDDVEQARPVIERASQRPTVPTPAP